MKNMIKHMCLSEECKRGIKWEPAEAYRVTEEETGLIHPVVWSHLCWNGMSELFAHKAQRCNRCGHSVISPECQRACKSASWSGVKEEAVGLPSRLQQGTILKTKDLWETKLLKLVLFDLLSSTTRVLRREGHKLLQQKGGRVAVMCRELIESESAPLAVSQLLY